MSVLSETETVRLNELMKEFDFKKVHKCMTLMDWSWATVTNKGGVSAMDYGVPSLKRIKENAKDLITRVIISYLRKNISGYSGSGGFQVSYNQYHNSLEIMFVLTEWNDEYVLNEDTYKTALKSEKRKKTIKKLLDGAGE